jgi:hypothetical protein
VRSRSFGQSASKRSCRVEKAGSSHCGDRVTKRLGDSSPCKPTDPNHIAGLTAQDGTGATGEVGQSFTGHRDRWHLRGPTPLAPVKRSMSASACRKIVANRKDARERFAFAGLWDRWRDPSGQWIKSCSILTTTPNAVTSTVHDRMPVILDLDSYDLRLDPGMTTVEAV